MRTPKVSVCIVTYNHEDYIEKCLESLVNQKTQFEFEIIVGDDCSTDRTTKIIKSFAMKYPNIIVPIFNKINLGPERNYFNVQNMARGEYIAYLDGDDYALPGKLQMQSDFLDKHSDCSMVFHECQVLHDGNYFNNHFIPEKIYQICDFIEFLYYYPNKSWHSSKMYRQSAIKTRLVSHRKFIDKHLHFEHGLSGKVGFINQLLGVYRANVGISSRIHMIQELALDAYDYALELGYDSKMVSKVIAREHFEHGLRCLEIEEDEYFKKWVSAGFKLGYKTTSSLLAFGFRNHPKKYKQTRQFLRDLRQKITSLKEF